MVWNWRYGIGDNAFEFCICTNGCYRDVILISGPLFPVFGYYWSVIVGSQVTFTEFGVNWILCYFIMDFNIACNCAVEYQHADFRFQPLSEVVFVLWKECICSFVGVLADWRARLHPLPYYPWFQAPIYGLTRRAPITCGGEMDLWGDE